MTARTRSPYRVWRVVETNFQDVPGVASNDAQNDATTGAEKRRAKRQRVLKRGQLVFGLAGSTIDCLIIDESCYGMLIETPPMSDFPERLRIRLAGGVTYDAVRRWTMGTKLGVEFLLPELKDGALVRRKAAIKLALKHQNVETAVAMLRDVNFFDNEDLRVVAEAAESAVTWLDSMLE